MSRYRQSQCDCFNINQTHRNSMKPTKKSVEAKHFDGKLLRREFSGIHSRVCTHFAETEMAPHSHSTTSFCVVLDGSCTEQYGRGTREYRLFDSEFLPAHQAHG